MARENIIYYGDYEGKQELADEEGYVEIIKYLKDVNRSPENQKIFDSIIFKLSFTDGILGFLRGFIFTPKENRYIAGILCSLFGYEILERKYKNWKKFSKFMLWVLSIVIAITGIYGVFHYFAKKSNKENNPTTHTSDHSIIRNEGDCSIACNKSDYHEGIKCKNEDIQVLSNQDNNSTLVNTTSCVFNYNGEDRGKSLVEILREQKHNNNINMQAMALGQYQARKYTR